VGEPINPEAWKWYYNVIGKGTLPICDTWWQTESGGFLITPLPSVALKPGSATRPFPGIVADVVDDDGNSCPPGTEGKLVIKTPWPGMLRTIYGDADRYIKQYWSAFPGKMWYLAGDAARKDEDSYFWIIGRMDEVIKVSGYRLGTAEIESGLVAHPAVAEAAAIGVPDEVRGNVIYAYCILRNGFQGSEKLVDELKEHIKHAIGPIAVPSKIEFVTVLPKTRSGKILRRVLKARATGMPEGDISTLEE
jgi:acetyl-CoA synthetase